MTKKVSLSIQTKVRRTLEADRLQRRRGLNVALKLMGRLLHSALEAVPVSHDDVLYEIFKEAWEPCRQWSIAFIRDIANGFKQAHRTHIALSFGKPGYRPNKDPLQPGQHLEILVLEFKFFEPAAQKPAMHHMIMFELETGQITHGSFSPWRATK